MHPICKNSNVVLHVHQLGNDTVIRQVLCADASIIISGILLQILGNIGRLLGAVNTVTAV